MCRVTLCVLWEAQDAFCASIDTAIVNGDIEEPKETSITSEDAKNMGVCIGSDANDSTWQIIDSELEDKNDKPQSGEHHV